MMQVLARTFAAIGLVGGALIGIEAQAADLIPAETRIVSLPGAPAPKEISFNIAAAQDLVVTLTDLATPAALNSATVVVTQADAVSGSASFAAPATSATVQLPGAKGDYTLRVFGAPDPSFSVGTFTACVAPKADPANCIQAASFADNITAQSASSDPTLSTLSLSLTVTISGAYTFTFADLNFPAALKTPASLGLFQGGTPVQGGQGFPSGTALTLNPGTYTLLAFAQADQMLKAGLYSLSITGPGIGITGPGVSTSAPDDVIPVGLMNAPGLVNNAAAQSVTLKVSDFAFPAPLGSANALLTAGSAVLGTATAAGGANALSAPAGTLKVWSFGSPGTGLGTYGVDLLAGSALLYSTAKGVNGTSTSSSVYGFATRNPVGAGAYQISVADLQFPSSLTGLSFAVEQNGTILAQSAVAGSVSVNAGAGPLVFLVSAQAPSSGSTSANGLFDVNVQTTGPAPSLIFDVTQSIGTAPALFDTQTISLGSTTSFDVTLTDLKFPVQFKDLALVVSRGNQVLGKIFGGGTFTFAGTPGNYQLSFIATPAADQKFGLYALKSVASPPVVNLSASVSTAVTGDSIKLSWSSTGADTCTASGGNWTGNKAVTATEEAVVVDATTTYTLSCTGAGGTTAQSVTVTATPKPGTSKSGGGGMEWIGLALLALVWLARSGSWRPPSCTGAARG
jgi:hypothetical protein